MEVLRARFIRKIKDNQGMYMDNGAHFLHMYNFMWSDSEYIYLFISRSRQWIVDSIPHARVKTFMDVRQ